MTSFSLDMASGDSVLAILIGLLGAFLLHLASKLLETSTPFHVSLTSNSKGPPVDLSCSIAHSPIFSSHSC